MDILEGGDDENPAGHPNPGRRKNTGYATRNLYFSPAGRARLCTVANAYGNDLLDLRSVNVKSPRPG